VPEPLRGAVWLSDLNPTRGREQQAIRPGRILSTNLFNRGPAELGVVLPSTSRQRSIPFHVGGSPPEGALDRTRFIKCEDIRAASKERALLVSWSRLRRDPPQEGY